MRSRSVPSAEGIITDGICAVFHAANWHAHLDMAEFTSLDLQIAALVPRGAHHDRRDAQAHHPLPEDKEQRGDESQELQCRCNALLEIIGREAETQQQ